MNTISFIMLFKKKAKKFLIFTNLVYLNIISKIITSDPLLSLVQSAGLI